MNRADLVGAIADQAALTKADAERALTAMLDAITESLKKDEPVVLVNFGTLTTRQRAAKTGRNPQTGEPMQIKATKVVGFKAGKALKDAIKDSAAK